MRAIFRYPGPLWKLTSAVGYIGVVLSVIPWTILIVGTVMLGVGRKTQTVFLRSWFSFVSWCHGLRYVVEGAEHFDPSQPSLVVSNHQGLYDIPAAYAALRGDLRMMAKAELFRIPGFGHVMAHTEFIPVHRESAASSRGAAEALLKRLRSGLHVWVAPEGTRSETGVLGNFKRGSFAIAIQAGIPIQPVLVLDSRLACPKGSVLPRPRSTIHVRVLPRISVEGYTMERRAELAQKVREIMLAEMFRAPTPRPEPDVYSSPLFPAGGDAPVMAEPRRI